MARISPNSNVSASKEPFDPSNVLEAIDKKYEHFLTECVSLFSNLGPFQVSELLAHINKKEFSEESASINHNVYCKVSDRLQKAVQEKEEKTEKLDRRLKNKRQGIENAKTELVALAQLHEIKRQERKQLELGVDMYTFTDEKLNVKEALLFTSELMLKMLLVVTLFALAAWGMIYSVAMSIGDVSEANLPNTTRTSSEEEDIRDERSYRACVSVAAWLSFGISSWALGLPFVFGAKKFSSYAMIFPVSTSPLPLVLFFFEVVHNRMNNYVFASITTVCGTSALLVFIWCIEMESEDETSFPDYVAGKRAAALLMGHADFKRRDRKTVRKAILAAALPSLFIVSVMMFYMFGIFAVFRVYDTSFWKLSITAVGLGVKIAGNKVLLSLIKSNAPWMADALLFFYEYATATLVRILMLSIPDEFTAILVGLVGCVTEICVRVFFFQQYLKAGMDKGKIGMNEEELYNYARWGKRRVQDGTNDMVVEYLSSIVASMLLIYLVPTGAFMFAVSDEIMPSTVLMLCAFQLVPELFLDFFCTFTECCCGLSTLHKNYWSFSSGARKQSKLWGERRSDVQKALTLKLSYCILITGIALAVCIKS